MVYFVVLITLFSSAIASESLPAWHMKPILSHVKPESPAETFYDSMISTKDFAEKYVIPQKPIIFRNVVKSWPAFTKWTDEYLAENYGNMELRLERKKEKSHGPPIGDVCLGRDSLKHFMSTYKTGADKYVVSELPQPMYKDVMIPQPMCCGELNRSFVEIDFWINSDMGKKGSGGKSILHKDAFNTVNCVVNGTKDWKLIELKYNDYVYQSWEAAGERGFGGFSLVHPEKVDARRFPNFGKIPRWELAHVNAGDCLYVPSQMWHQVNSYGASNKAIAFLFSRFDKRKKLDTKGCSKMLPDIPLSDIDVDLQYPGYGDMTMGDFEMEAVYIEIRRFVNRKKGLVTKNKIYKAVKTHHEEEGPAPEYILQQKADNIYVHLLAIAGGDVSKMKMEFIKNLTRAQVRVMYPWLFKVDSANSCDYEYASITPESISGLISELQQQNGGKLIKSAFVEGYLQLGGTDKFANNFWRKLAVDEEMITNTRNLKEALFKYEENRTEDPDAEEEDEEDRNTTPQGHKTQAKKHTASYEKRYEEHEKVDEGGGSNTEIKDEL